MGAGVFDDCPIHGIEVGEGLSTVDGAPHAVLALWWKDDDTPPTVIPLAFGSAELVARRLLDVVDRYRHAEPPPDQ